MVHAHCWGYSYRARKLRHPQFIGVTSAFSHVVSVCIKLEVSFTPRQLISCCLSDHTYTSSSFSNTNTVCKVTFSKQNSAKTDISSTMSIVFFLSLFLLSQVASYSQAFSSAVVGETEVCPGTRGLPHDIYDRWRFAINKVADGLGLMNMITGHATEVSCVAFQACGLVSHA